MKNTARKSATEAYTHAFHNNNVQHRCSGDPKDQTGALASCTQPFSNSVGLHLPLALASCTQPLFNSSWSAAVLAFIKLDHMHLHLHLHLQWTTCTSANYTQPLFNTSWSAAVLAWLDQSHDKGGVIATLDSYLPAAKPATSCLGQPSLTRKKIWTMKAMLWGSGKWTLDRQRMLEIINNSQPTSPRKAWIPKLNQ